MLFACFVTKNSVDAALQEQLHTFWDVLSWGNLNPKQEYKHVLQLTKKNDDRRRAFKIAQKAIAK